MGRPKFTNRQRAAVLARPDNPYLPGHCWHCGVVLGDGFHVDHFPIKLADIEGQVCWGVRNPRELTNAVPSCGPCNVSHRHESTRWCGRSQCRCTREGVMWLAIAGLGLAAVSGWSVAGWLAWAGP